MSTKDDLDILAKVERDRLIADIEKAALRGALLLLLLLRPPESLALIFVSFEILFVL